MILLSSLKYELLRLVTGHMYRNARKLALYVFTYLFIFCFCISRVRILIINEHFVRLDHIFLGALSDLGDYHAIGDFRSAISVSRFNKFGSVDIDSSKLRSVDWILYGSLWCVKKL